MRAIHMSASVSRLGGGVAPIVWTLARYQQAAGLQMSLASLKDKYTFADVPLQSGIECFTGRLVGPKVLGYSPELRRYLRAQDGTVDILHSHGLWMYPGYAVHVIGKKDAIPYIVSPHGMLDPWALKNSAWKKKLAGWLYEDRNLRSAACIHALCESEYQSIRAYGLKNPVCIIPNGVDLPQDGPKLAPPWTEMAKPGRKVILFLGRIHPKKGLNNLIEAWSRLRKCSISTASEWALVIAGWSQNGYEEELSKMVHEKGLTQDIIFIGPIFDDKKKACLQNADAFVLPSFSEGLPMSVLEAWSYSLPVVMTRECNIPEGFEAGAAVEVLPEIDSVADGLKSFFLLSAAERKNMGLRGRNLVEAKFSWPQIAGQMIEVYKWVLGQGRQPDCVRLN